MNISKEIVLYQSLPFKKYRWISYVSFFQVGFLALNLIVLPTRKLLEQRSEALENKFRKKQRDEQEQASQDVLSYFEEYEPNPEYDPATFLQRFKRLSWGETFNINNIKENVIDRPAMSLGLVGAAILVSSAYWLYARRMVHMITLLPNERVRLSFFSPIAYGKPPMIEIPLKSISCVQSRKSKNNYSILKVRGYKGFHLVHKIEGEFLEPKLYDKYLGYERSWAGK